MWEDEMEQLATEVQELRKKVEFQGRVIGIFLIVVIVSFLTPLLSNDGQRQFVVATDVLNARAVHLANDDGGTAILTSDHLMFSGSPSSVAVSIGVDADRQPAVSLFFESEDSPSGKASSASMMIHRNAQGAPRAMFIDEDGRAIPWSGN